MSLEDLLRKRSEEIEPPKLLPQGHYLTTVSGIGQLSTIGKNNTDIVEFPLVVIAPGEDVDPVELSELGKPVAGRKLNARFFLTEDAVHRLTEFFEKLDLPQSASIRENINGAANRQITVRIKHKPYTDDNNEPRFRQEITGYVKA